MNRVKNTVFKVAIMVFCLCVCLVMNVSAADEYKCSQIIYTNGAGEPVTSISSGQLNAQITVSQAEGTTPESMVFVMLLYSDGKLIDASIDAETPFTASVTVPDDGSECWVNTVLWNSIGGMTPLCNSSLMPGGSNEVVKITVDGNEIENFDYDTGMGEYAVTMKRTVMPVVDVTTLDSGAKVEIENPTTFPGKTVVKVTSVDGDEKTYTIKYICEENLIENVRLVQEFASNPRLPELKHDLQIGAYIASDRTYTAEDILPELVGCDYIAPSLGWANSSATLDFVQAWKSTDYGDWMGFELKRSATVHILCTGGSTTMNKRDYVRTTGGITTSNNLKYTTRYTKHYEVGDEPVTVITPSTAQTNTYIHVIVYDGYED